MPKTVANGVDIYWERHGEGDPVVLIQGLGANHRFWAPLVPLFSPHVEVLLFDWPGTGSSGDLPSEPSISTEWLADTVAAWIEAIELPAAHIVGRSMGGCIAQQLAIRHPARVRSLALASTWARADGFLASILGSWPTLLESGGDALLLSQAGYWAFPRHFYSDDYQREEQSVEGVIEEAINLKQRPAQFRRLVQAGISHDAVSDLNRIEVPTAVMAGRQDILTPITMADTLYQLTPGATYVVFEGAGHGFYEQMPRKFADALLSLWEHA